MSMEPPPPPPPPSAVVPCGGAPVDHIGDAVELRLERVLEERRPDGRHRASSMFGINIVFSV